MEEEKIKVLVVGCSGHMGQIVCRLIEESDDMEVVLGYDKVKLDSCQFPICQDLINLDFDPNSIDVIIDFSSPVSTLEVLIDCAALYKIPIVIATTGFTNDQLALIEKASYETPIFMSSNMSYEINLLCNILQQIAPKMVGYDIEILEAHHNRKKDAPSGTAKTLANAINDSLGGSRNIVYGRTDKREENEIGISSIRGGNIVGEHTVSFIGPFDSLEIKHTAHSRDLFAEGALKAARFMVQGRNFDKGLYGMKDLE